MTSPIDRMVDAEREEARQEREALFGNEALVIKVLQAVSGGSLIAALAQSGTLIKLAGRFPFLVFLTAMGLGLVAAVIAAHCKHQYKMWEVRARSVSDNREAKTHWVASFRYLKGMRGAIWSALLAIVIGFAELLAFFWVCALQGNS